MTEGRRQRAPESLAIWGKDPTRYISLLCATGARKSNASGFRTLRCLLGTCPQTPGISRIGPMAWYEGETLLPARGLDGAKQSQFQPGSQAGQRASLCKTNPISPPFGGRSDDLIVQNKANSARGPALPRCSGRDLPCETKPIPSTTKSRLTIAEKRGYERRYRFSAGEKQSQFRGGPQAGRGTWARKTKPIHGGVSSLTPQVSSEESPSAEVQEPSHETKPIPRRRRAAAWDGRAARFVCL